jgi:hypothetical protein
MKTNHRYAYKRTFATFVFACCALPFFLSGFTAREGTVKTGTLKITFVNTANGKPLVLNDSMYTTPSGEQYRISKLKYYISNIILPGNTPLDDTDNYQLIDAAKELSFDIPVKEGKYRSIRFLLGVDSIRNCSGAQTGALDPMNDMFWTWNTGYVMLKLEGTSPASPSDRQRIEHHVGGYRFGNNVATAVILDIPEIKIKADAPASIVIEVNMDKYWNSVNTIRISEIPVCTLPGALAKKIAANFSSMFSVKSIQDN